MSDFALAGGGFDGLDAGRPRHRVPR
jgi:hypothetical protein